MSYKLSERIYTGKNNNHNEFTYTTCVVIISSLRRGESHEQIAITLNRDFKEYMKMLEDSKKSGLYKLAEEILDDYSRSEMKLYTFQGT